MEKAKSLEEQKTKLLEERAREMRSVRANLEADKEREIREVPHLACHPTSLTPYLSRLYVAPFFLYLHRATSFLLLQWVLSSSFFAFVRRTVCPTSNANRLTARGDR